MLILSRKAGEKIVIGEGPNQVTVEVTKIDRNRVTLGIAAPDETHIRRSELPPRTEHRNSN